MHQVSVNGLWMPLDEFLTRAAAADLATQRRTEAEDREAQMRQDLENRLAIERAERGAVEKQLAAAQWQQLTVPPLNPPPLPRQVGSPASASQPPLPVDESNRIPKGLIFACLGGGALLLIGFAAVAAIFFSSSQKSIVPGASVGEPKAQAPVTAPTPAPPVHRIEESIFAVVQRSAEETKQKIYDSIHPAGRALNVSVRDVSVTDWKDGHDTNRFEDIQQFTVRYTLYWETPAVKEGYTKILQTYDAPSQRYISCQVIETNGITKKDLLNAIGPAFGADMLEAARDRVEPAADDHPAK
jgi:hypothetical protein